MIPPEVIASTCSTPGLHLVSGGQPVVPHAMQLELPAREAAFADHEYVSDDGNSIHLRGLPGDLFWFQDRVLNFIYAPHIVEHFDPVDIRYLLGEWTRVIKPGGHLLIETAPERMVDIKDVLRLFGVWKLVAEDADWLVVTMSE